MLWEETIVLAFGLCFISDALLNNYSLTCDLVRFRFLRYSSMKSSEEAVNGRDAGQQHLVVDW